MPHKDLERRRLFWVWKGMVRRCRDKSAKNWPAYGGRGIKVCARWAASFTNYETDIGQRPSGMSLGRIDNDGHYEPSNVRWETAMQQHRNTTRNVFLEFQGEKMCARDWSKRLGINPSTLTSRLLSGWSAERALTTPVGKRREARP